MKLVPVVCGSVASFVIFFLGSFNFENHVTSDKVWYASELICRQGSADHVCLPSQPSQERLFRGRSDEPRFQQDMGNHGFASTTFAQLLNTLFDGDDTYREVLLKSALLKSGFISVFFATLIFGYQRFPLLRPFIARTLIVSYSVPFLVFAGASVYPAGLGIIALSGFLIAVKMIENNSNTSPLINVALLTTSTMFAFIAMSNRFEAAVLILLAVVLHFASEAKTKDGKREKFKFRATLLAMAIGLIAVISFANSFFRTTLETTLRGDLLVVSPAITSRGEMVLNRFGLPGSAAYSLLALPSFADNSSRYFVNTFYSQTLESIKLSDSRHWWALVVLSAAIVAAWFPMTLVILGEVQSLTKRLYASVKSRQFPEKRVFAQLLFPVLFVALPWFARITWFLQYALPFFLVFLFFGNSNRPLRKVEMMSLQIVIASNILAMVSTNLQFGALHLGGLVFDQQLLSVGFSLSVVVLIASFRSKSVASRLPEV